MSLDKLLMQVALIDQVTKPLQGITKQMQSTMDAGRTGMANMATGGAGLVATGMAIQSALMPAIEMDRKVGEVKSLGVTDEALKQLQATALDFSVEYGKSATDFINASYDIQSAIAGLKGDELSQFTRASGVLAAATKADTSTITDYMGTLYGIFETSANQMGKAQWVEQMAGMTASAVQMFKTDGTKMAQSFRALGSSATAMGADVSEQMAVLGTLQATMSGSEAATKYTAFLSGAVTAQDKLGLSFTNSEGQLLPMVDILSKLDGKIGSLGEAEQYAMLKDAFGSKEAVKLIQNLMPKTDALAQSIETLGQVQGMSKAEEMAASMTDQWERLDAVWFALRASLFGAILPGINSVVGAMVSGLHVISVWVDEFPVLGQILGYTALAGISLGGVVAGLSLALGIGQMMSAGWALTMGTLNGVFKVLRIQTALATVSAWLFNAALWANPITWVIAGIGLLVAGVAAVIYWWDDLTAAFADTAVFKFLSDTIDWIIDKLNMLPGVDIDLNTGEIPSAPALAASQQSQGVSPVADIVTMGAALTQPPSGDDDMVSPVARYKQPQNQTPLPKNMVHNATTVNKQQGGNVKQYGDIHITTQQAFTPDQMAEWDELNVG